MADKKQTGYFPLLVISVFALLPLVFVKTLVDNTLIPHQLFGSVGLLILLLMILASKRTGNFVPGWVTGCFAGFLIINVISVFAAINPVESWATISRYCFSFAFLITLIYLLREKRIEGTHIIKGVIILGSLAAIITFFNLMKALQSGKFIDNIYSVSGTFSHKNLLSSILMLSLPFAIMGRIVLKKAWKSWSSFLIFLLIIEVFILRTRGVWIGIFGAAVIMLIVFFLMRKNEIVANIKFPFKIVGLSMVIAAFLVVVFSLNSKLGKDVTDTGTFGNRLKFWEASIEMLKENPALGVGAGNWKINFPKYGINSFDNSVIQGITHIQRPHNDYLWVLAEGGPLALIFFLGIFLAAFWHLAGNLRNTSSKDEWAVDMTIGFGLLAYAIFSSADFPLERSSHLMVLMALMALVYRNRPIVSKIQIKSNPGVFILLLLTLFSIVVSIYRWSGESHSVKVLQANAARNAQMIVPEAEAALNPFYNMDNFANPVMYYSSLGKLVQKDIIGAREDAQDAYAIHPYNIIVLNQLGNTYKAKKEFDEAMKYYVQATDISFHFEAAQLSKAEIALTRGDYLLAMEYLSAIFHNSRNPRYDQYLAAALPAVVNNFEKHKRFKPLVNYMRSKNPRNVQEMVQYYKSFGSSD